MIEEQALVVGLDQEYVSLEIIRTKPCGICGQTRGCGASIWGRLFGHRPNIFKVKNSLNARMNDVVLVGIDERALLLGAFYVYGIPLMGVFLGAGLANYVYAGTAYLDKLTALGGLFGLIVGFVWLRVYQQQGRQVSRRYNPVLLNVTSNQINQCQLRMKK
jgi:sigma-E factor negative regulatory protein RseC